MSARAGSERDRGFAWVFVKAALFTLLVPGSVVGLVPYLLLDEGAFAAIDVEGWAPLGALPIALGVALYLRCAFDFVFAGRGTPAFVDAPIRLVIRGPYRYSRNPMYVAIFAVLIGEALLFGAVRLLVLALVMALAFCWFIFGHEERVLRQRFGDEYVRYCAAVPRWIPRPSSLAAIHAASFAPIGAFVLAAGVLAHVAKLSVGLPVGDMPLSIHAALVILAGYAAVGCVAYARRVRLPRRGHKLVFAVITALLAITAVMHAYSIVSGDNSWLAAIPKWYSIVAAPIYGGFAWFMGSRPAAGD